MLNLLIAPLAMLTATLPLEQPKEPKIVVQEKLVAILPQTVELEDFSGSEEDFLKLV